jgi:5-(carboxyamino)imidazole ribonucleotide mutase
MPDGIPVATVGVGKARNAGLLAARILGGTDPALRARLDEYQASLATKVREKDADLRGEK